MAKRKKINIQENTRPNSEIKENKKPLVDENGIIVDFSLRTAFYSCKVDKYTNYLCSHDEFIKFRKKLFGEALDYFKSKKFSELVRDRGSHTHVIREKKQLDLIEKILKSLIKNAYTNLDEKSVNGMVDNYMQEIWQLGYKQGLRLIGVRTQNVFTVLFIDHHHLIYPSQNYNDKDFFKYNYCAMRN